MVTWRPFCVKAPGRVSLFGEHSDYLGLDVIPAAIDLSIEITANPREDNIIRVNYLDMQESDRFSIDKPLEYRHRRDYLRSAFNVLLRENAVPEIGWNLQVTGDIPIAAGLSSSSALTVASVMAFCHMANERKTEQDLVDLAFRAEVTEFGESGGRMDHFASVFGGLIHVNTMKNTVTPLPDIIEGLVIGDSMEKKKDTVGDLRRIRLAAEQGYNLLSERIASFSQRETPLDEVLRYVDALPRDIRLVTETTLRNRDLTSQAFDMIRLPNPEIDEIGDMLGKHHELLRDGLQRSTPKIERMIDAAMDAGALGCKINGSGGGGSMVAYAPGRQRAVADAVESVGGRSYLVKVSEGASLTIL